MADQTIRVLGFAGSLRAKSFNRMALAEAAAMAPAGVSVEIVDLRHLPLYDEDLYQAGTCAPATEFREKVAAADALLMAVPEYNYSVSGVLKNALDWASRPPKVPLYRKPYAMFGCSGGALGTVRAQFHLRQILVNPDMPGVNKPEVYIGAAQNKFDADGRLTDEIARKMLGELLVNLRDLTLRMRG
jgi:chromate reductase